MNLRVPWKPGNFSPSWVNVSFSRRTSHHGVSVFCDVSNLTPLHCRLASCIFRTVLFACPLVVYTKVLDCCCYLEFMQRTEQRALHLQVILQFLALIGRDCVEPCVKIVRVVLIDAHTHEGNKQKQFIVGSNIILWHVFVCVVFRFSCCFDPPGHD
jgi:hypothetical protein